MSSDQAPPELKKLDLAIARLRLLLADLSGREESLTSQHRTLRDQREKLLTFALYGNSTLESVLAMLRDVEGRMADVDGTQRVLQAVRGRAEGELESLQLTKTIDEANARLADLRTSQAELGALREDVVAEIRDLESIIREASERAARGIGETARRSN